MSDSGEEECPLCLEEIDSGFIPCPCGYRVCMFCWHHIRENVNGLCPACRSQYSSDPHAFSVAEAPSKKEKKKKDKDKKEKDKGERLDNRYSASAGAAKSAPGLGAPPISDRRHLHNYRVIQRNLVYVIGLPSGTGSEDTLRRAEYFGQYGRIAKVVVHKSQNSSHSSVSAYITYVHKEDAKAAIQVIEGFSLDSHYLRASFGTTKYCNNFIRGIPCTNPECVYLHELGEDEDRFTKEEIQAGQSKIMPNPGHNQSLVTGRGGPSGTGKRLSGSEKGVLPPPIFIEDNPKKGSSSTDGVSVSTKQMSWAANGVSGIKEKGQKEMPLTKSEKNDKKNIEEQQDNEKSSGRSAGKSEKGAHVEKKSSGLQLSIKNNRDKSVDLVEPSRLNTSIVDDVNKIDDKVDSLRVSSAMSIKEIQKDETNNAPSKYAEKKQDIKGDLPMPEKVSQEMGEKDIVALKAVQDTIQMRLLPAYDAKVEPSFNGFGRCAVFPVPISSLAVSAWATVLRTSSNNSKILGDNPFNGIRVSVSEMLDVTLPPVDAMCLQPWPKPLSHYGNVFSNNRIEKDENEIEGGEISTPVMTESSKLNNSQGSLGSESEPEQSSLAALQSIFPSANVFTRKNK